MNMYTLRFKIVKGRRIFDSSEPWEDITLRHGITRYKTEMNHWESWIEVQFKSESYRDLFKITFSEYLTTL